MDRASPPPSSRRRTEPHARGDGPCFAPPGRRPEVSEPHELRVSSQWRGVPSACVVNRDAASGTGSATGPRLLERSRGGAPVSSGRTGRRAAPGAGGGGAGGGWRLGDRGGSGGVGAGRGSGQAQGSPLRVNSLGAVPGAVEPMKPKLAVPPGAMVPFQPASRAVTSAPVWVTSAFHACAICWLPGKDHVSSQPLIVLSPVLVIVTSLWKPLPHSLATR